MEEEMYVDKSESTDEIEDKSDTDLDFSEKPESEINQSEVRDNIFQCGVCFTLFANKADLVEHKSKSHPIIIFKCQIEGCDRWFMSKRSRDTHALNGKPWLHRVENVKPPPPNAVFIEEMTKEQIKAMQLKRKRGPKPKNESDFLGGFNKVQLKRKLMESVIEQIDCLPVKKPCIDEKTNNEKIAERNLLNETIRERNALEKETETILTFRPRTPPKITGKPKKPTMPDMSKYIGRPLQIRPTLPEFIQQMIQTLDDLDRGNYFKFPFIEHFAPKASQISNQMYLIKIRENHQQNLYNNNLPLFKDHLLSVYSKAFFCYPENSEVYKAAGNLYKTVLINMEKAEEKFSLVSVDSSTSLLKEVLEKETSDFTQRTTTHLPILNPYNKGVINDRERIEQIGNQVGTLSQGTPNLNEFKEDRRNKISVWSYLDYGPNFSFGPTYDSGNSYCTEEMNQLLYKCYNNNTTNDTNTDANNEKVDALNKSLELVIPEPGLGDDFSLYLMNALTYDVLLEEKKRQNENNSSSESIPETNPSPSSSKDATQTVDSSSTLQKLLDDNWTDLSQLKDSSYRRLSDLQVTPSPNELYYSQKTLSNLSQLISHTKPADVVDTNRIHQLLKY